MRQKLGRVLITGGAGFIGSNLIKLLNERNVAQHIKVIDNESVGSQEVLKPYDVEFMAGDIRDQASLKHALKSTDTVVHLAADTRVMDSIENPSFNFENNVIASFNLLMAMRDTGVNKLVNASTGGAIIGNATPPVHEDMVANPLSPYGAAKLAVEGYCSAFAGAYGLETISLRFSNVYGPLSYHKGSVVAAYMKQLMLNKPLIVYGDGSQTRDYVFTEDLCQGIVDAMCHASAGVYQLGTGIPTSINQLIEQIQIAVGEQTPVEVEYREVREGEVLHTHCDVRKAKQAFGYAPDTPLAHGLSKTWQWFCQSHVNSRFAKTA